MIDAFITKQYNCRQIHNSKRNQERNQIMKGKLFRRMSALTLAFVMASGFAPGVQAAKKNPCTQQSAQAAGFENETASLKLNQIGRYDSGMTNADGGVMEIVDYNKKMAMLMLSMDRKACLL